jgi:hypothetical protein
VTVRRGGRGCEASEAAAEDNKPLPIPPLVRLALVGLERGDQSAAVEDPADCGEPDAAELATALVLSEGARE